MREDSDLTQSEIAKIIHMHKTTYVRYESGEREIPLNIAILSVLIILQGLKIINNLDKSSRTVKNYAVRELSVCG